MPESGSGSSPNGPVLSSACVHTSPPFNEKEQPEKQTGMEQNPELHVYTCQTLCLKEQCFYTYSQTGRRQWHLFASDSCTSEKQTLGSQGRRDNKVEIILKPPAQSPGVTPWSSPHGGRHMPRPYGPQQGPPTSTQDRGCNCLHHSPHWHGYMTNPMNKRVLFNL